MVRFIIAKRLHLIREMLIAALALSSLPSPASAQTYHEFFGPPLPLVFDAEGARHWCLYGYYGPFIPPVTSKESHIMSCSGEGH